MAADRLLAAIEGGASHGPYLHPCRLAVRESTGAIREPVPDGPR
jgi:DNA-binding LacI/PurR family transcriptional regulator